MMQCKELIEKGICHADCCGLVWDKEENIIPVDENGKCTNLDENLQCKIYDKRPSVCRKYGTIEELQCPYIDLRGRIRTPAKQRRMQRIINHQVEYSMKRFKRLKLFQ